jgi:hypothetical protein
MKNKVAQIATNMLAPSFNSFEDKPENQRE